MTDASILPLEGTHRSGLQRVAIGPFTSRTLLGLVIGAALVAGLDWPRSHVVFSIDVDLIRVLRFMAIVKAAMAAAVLTVLFWRLAVPINIARLGVYAVSSGAMTMGPVLIWTMDHVVAGALVLHGGLIALVVLLWRDPSTAARLTDLVRARSRVQRNRFPPWSDQRAEVVDVTSAGKRV